MGEYRLFLDMDGTLFKWRTFINEDGQLLTNTEEIYEMLTTPGYFFTLPPHQNILDLAKILIKDPEIDVYILSCVIPDSKKNSPLNEKNLSLDKYIPEIDRKHRIFVPNGEEKTKYVPGGVSNHDFLLDDYTSKNLRTWEANNGIGIKLLNGINSSKGTWKGNRINYQENAENLAIVIKQIIKNKSFYFQKRPQNQEDLEYLYLSNKKEIKTQMEKTLNDALKDKENKKEEKFQELDF